MRLDDERVAAVYDGRLGAEDRDEVLEQVLADDFESHVFAETAAVLRELEAASAVSPPAASDAAHDGAVSPRLMEAPAAGPTETVPPDAAAGPADGVISLDSWRNAPPAAATGPIAETPAPEHGTAPADDVISIESRRKRPRRAWAYGALAAGIAAIGLTFAVLNRSSDRGSDPADAVATLEDGAVPGLAVDYRSPWAQTRGGGDDQSPVDQVAVRVGTRLFDLELAAAINDTAAIHDLSRQVVALLRDVPAGGQVDDHFEQLGQGAPEVKELLEKGRDDVRQRLTDDWLNLGIWAEAARTAAVRHDTTFFRSPKFERVLGRVEKLREAGATTKGAIHAVRDALPVDGRATNWDELHSRLTYLMRVAGAPEIDLP